MHELLETICDDLEAMAKAVRKIGNEQTLSSAHGNANFPSIDREELSYEASDLAEEIRAKGPEKLGDYEDYIQDYSGRIKYLHSQTINQIWGNPVQAVPAYLLTLYGLKKAITPILINSESVSIRLTKQMKRLRSITARLDDLDPKTASLKKVVDEIKSAHEAADQLPQDLQSLKESRQIIENTLKSSAKHEAAIQLHLETAISTDKELKRLQEEADQIIDRCRSAYRNATSVGLAVAF